jgi:hypothetical protein
MKQLCPLCSCMKVTLTTFVIDDFCCDHSAQRNRKKYLHHKVCDSVNDCSRLEELNKFLG